MVKGMTATAVIAAILALVTCMAGASGASDSNKLANVEAFPLDYNSGSMAVHALASCLKTYGIDYPYGRLMLLSRAIYKFVYDTTEAYEPLRDIYPSDVLQAACAELGFKEAHWETNRPIEEVKEIVKREIDAGHPVLAPFLKPDAYHGFFIITGYDYDEGVFFLRGAFGTGAEAVVPIPETWDGPTVSPAGWATNPVFVIGARSGQDPDRVPLYREGVQLGISIMRGGTLTYGSHPGEQVYMAVPGPHTAGYGLDAYGLLAADVATEPLVVQVGEEQHLNFGFIWRIDAQIGQLQHDRSQGAGFLHMLAGGLPVVKRPELDEIVRSFRLAAKDAKDLRHVFWNEMPNTLISPDKIGEYVRESQSLVFKLPPRHGLPEHLKEEGHQVFKTLWGWVLIDDSDAKRLSARLLVKSLESRDKSSLRMLERIVGHVDKRTEPDGAEDRTRP